MSEDWDAAEVHRLLDSLEQRTHARLRSVRGDHHEVVSASTDANADDEHDPESSTIAFERQQLAALMGDAEEQLAEIQAARQRLEDGLYGTCADCGQPIVPERLRARPTARRCVTCG